MPSPGAVVIGGYINGLGLIRSLASLRIPTAVISTQPYDLAHTSRLICAAEDAQSRDGGVIEILDRRASDWKGWALIPATDDALLEIAEHQEQLAQCYTIIAPPPEVVRQVLDKRRMRRVAESIGIPLPRCYGKAAAEMVSPQLRYPLLVKPVMSHEFARQFNRKLLVANDEQELREQIQQVQQAGIDCELFDWIPGGDDQIFAYCTYINRRGESNGGVTIHKIRQSPPFFGVARVAEAIRDIPNLRDMSLSLLKQIDFRGMAAVEFKRDPRDGTFRYMELNGRSVIYNSLLRQSGLDLARLAWRDFSENKTEKASFNDWPGVWVNLHADLLYSATRRGGDPVRWSDFIAPYTRPIIEALWEPHDRKPFFVQWSRTARQALSRTRPTAR